MSQKSVLVLGFDPKFVPESEKHKFPTKSGAAAVYAIEDQVKAANYDAKSVLVDQGETAVEVATEALKSRQWDFVCIGAGVRLGPESAVLLLENFINLVYEYAPQAKLCFNESPDTTVAAVKRWDVRVC